eukprot:7884760-Pyramimonas_sp.AAC.1
MASQRSAEVVTHSVSSLRFIGPQKPPLSFGGRRHAMLCHTTRKIFNTMLCHALLRHATTSDCANREEICAM